MIAALAACACTSEVSMELAPTRSDSWTFVDLPDTQMYAKAYPETFEAQMRWIADPRATHRIQFVLPEGDIVDNTSDPQWMVARKAFDLIENVVPYAVVPGNLIYGGT